jgi:hypothetical protein
MRKALSWESWKQWCQNPAPEVSVKEINTRFHPIGDSAMV